MENRKTDDRKKDLYSLLLLAGGKSSRMGRDKAELLLGEKSFLECILEKAEMLGIRKKYLSGHGWEGKGVRTVPDRYRERGPLGGMHACFSVMDTPYALVLPVDVPQISMSVLQILLDAHGRLLNKNHQEYVRPLLLSHGERTEPLIGIYPAMLGRKIGAIIEKKPAPVFRLLDETGYDICRVSAREWELGNINTPKDYEMLLEQRKRGIEK
ncbi:MAG TPA: molybdenum cofactor guanylyltransferase [Candidatus Blautia excrementigallinarum]|nr:molybdenum cofactor guanylyltransferase [Candidatus Blautia excrementigallinarum]